MMSLKIYSYFPLFLDLMFLIASCVANKGNTASHEYANDGKDECCDGFVQGTKWSNP